MTVDAAVRVKPVPMAVKLKRATRISEIY